MDSCFQFRMSRKEIDEYFADKKVKGIPGSYVVGNRIINYLETSPDKGPTVLFVHGSPGSLSAFIDFMADTSLCARAHLITIDRPGFGYSNFGNAEASIQKQAALLMTLVEKTSFHRPIVLVGHSLGGPVVARMAMDYPELIDGIVLVSPSIDPSLEPKEWYRTLFATPFLSWILPRSIRASNDEIYKLKPELEEMLPHWSKVKARVTVIQGGKDSLVDPRNAEFALKMMNNTNVILIQVEDMDHFVPWTNPELIRDAILDQLDSLR
jgi:pimeloyl-ACP methyl ester carboxylesterase